jgi:diguanylate cyclase (GGDEF)-like protein
MYGLDNGGMPESTGVGANYIAVCLRSAAAGCTDARAVADGFAAVMRGESVECELQYPCPAPSVTAAERWFNVRITRIGGADPGALVSHVNVGRRKAAEELLERKASEDPLTGLANRRLFLKRLATGLTSRPGEPPRSNVGLAFVALDGLRTVNDRYGYAAGDDVLQVVASRLVALVRPEDTAARITSDEFAILAPQLDAAGLERLVAQIAHALHLPHVVAGAEIEVAASIGSYLAQPGESVRRADEPPGASLRRAIAALDALKRASRTAVAPPE